MDVLANLAAPAGARPAGLPGFPGRRGQVGRPADRASALRGIGSAAGVGIWSRAQPHEHRRQRRLVAAQYCCTTLAGMRPRPLTAMPGRWPTPGYHRCAAGSRRCGPAGGARPCGRARGGSQLLAERGGVLCAQVDLILRPAEGEPHGLIGGAATKVVFQRDGYSLCHFDLRDCPGVPAPYPAGMTGHCRNTADHMRRSRTVVTSRRREHCGPWARTSTGMSHSVIGLHGRTRA
jgi:hypothetical protein